MSSWLVELKITEEIEADSIEEAIEKVESKRVGDYNVWDEEVSRYTYEDHKADKL